MSVAHLTLRQLQAIQAIYVTRRISAAAQRMNISQSTASVLLGQAETALGVRLFDRTTRALTPTRAVEQVIGIVERILGDLDALGATVNDLKDLERGQVRITATPATGLALLPRTIKRFKAAYPGIAIVMNDCAPDQFFTVIEAERADFGLGLPPSDRMRFDWHAVQNDTLHVVCHRDHPFARLTRVRWRDLDNQPMIVARRAYGIRDLVQTTMEAVGARQTIANEIGFLYSAEWMAACGMGIAIFPRCLAEATHDPDLVSRPLVDPAVTRPTAVVTKRGRTLSPSAKRFVEMLSEDLSVPHRPL
ncbi:MAG: LysR family transcriptional regulator [Qingshengfaniella sp.]